MNSDLGERAQGMLIQPFIGLRPLSALVQQMAAPPYDVLDRQEALQLASSNPYSFLHVSKAEIDLPADISPYDLKVYQTARQNLQHMKEQGWLVRDGEPSLYLYRLVMGDRQQVGVVAAAAVAGLESERIKRHEFTRPDKEQDRTLHASTIGAHSGPVFLTFRSTEKIASLVARGCACDPLYDFTASDGVVHTLWRLADQALISELVAAFEALEAVYIADGHHRSAAALAIAKKQRSLATGEEQGGGEPLYERFLTVLFPADQVQIMDYNRVVRDLNGLTPEAFLQKVQERFTVTPSSVPVRPKREHEFGLFLAGAWYRLTLAEDWINAQDPVARLDVSLLNVHLLEPILGIMDPRRDPRIDFVGGIRGLEVLVEQVQSGEMAVAIALYPTQLTDVMAVADAGQVMPPKSTWFEPKLRDGLIIQEI
ncbi:MAG: DUF1015 family protein [Magnetococcus sp. DMHC-6]